jgi:hypothetical protein
LAQRLGERLSRLFGVSEELDARLRRFHSPQSVSTFQTRQLGWTMASFGAARVVAVTARPLPRCKSRQEHGDDRPPDLRELGHDSPPL